MNVSSSRRTTYWLTHVCGTMNARSSRRTTYWYTRRANHYTKEVYKWSYFMDFSHYNLALCFYSGNYQKNFWLFATYWVLTLSSHYSMELIPKHEQYCIFFFHFWSHWIASKNINKVNFISMIFMFYSKVIQIKITLSDYLQLKSIVKNVKHRMLISFKTSRISFVTSFT